ncbi:MAG: SdpI family protein [Flavobacteriales bacterium]|nr:SdpI family protein [Flavobacteriales bacterium]
MMLLLIPPKTINNFYGYRTKRSKRSKRSWDFAQKYSAIRILESGLLALLISIGNYFTTIKLDIAGLLMLICIVIGICLMNVLLRTEARLKKMSW